MGEKPVKDKRKLYISKRLIGIALPAMFLFFLLASGILEVLSYWHPHQHTSWNDVIGETHINTGIHGDVYVIDLFEHHGLIPELIRLFKPFFFLKKTVI